VSFQLEFWNAASFRQRLLPPLFPRGEAGALLELAARHALSAPVVPFTPAAATAADAGRLAQLALGVAAPATCSTDGDDVDGDGHRRWRRAR
jgi:hypothetical protein